MGYDFADRGDILRIRAAVQAHEAGRQRPPSSRPPPPTNDTVVARLVARDGADAWKVTTWKQVRRKQDGSYEDVPDGINDQSGAYPAFERQRKTDFHVGATAGDVVVLRRESVKAADGAVTFGWAFDLGTGGGFWALVVSAALISGHAARWLYEVAEVNDAEWAADGTPELLAGGRTGPALNTIEANNPAGGIGRMGTGVEVTAAEFSSTTPIRLQPIEPGKAVIWVRPSRDCDGNERFRFEGYNTKSECAA